MTTTTKALLMSACLAAAPACASPAGGTTQDGESQSSGASTTSTTSGGPTTAEEPTSGGPTTGSTATTGGATSGSSGAPGSTGGPDTTGTGGADTGSTDTGMMACAPSWLVPAVPAEELAKHDLRWVGCELTTCGPEDEPPPGEPSVLCDEFSLDGVPLEYLGQIHPNDSGAFTTAVISPNNIAWLDAPRHTYRYGDSVYLMTLDDGPVDQLEVFFAVRALELLRTGHPVAYQRLVVDTQEYPADPPLDGLGWKNRARSFVISFDPSPLYIAAGVTVLDAAPTKDKNLDQYSNTPAISIDSETILGKAMDVGSGPIYGEYAGDENFLRYMREGVADTLLHELLHRSIDRLNSVDARMNDLYFRRGDPTACAAVALEEALVAAASLLHFRKSGGIGAEYLDYYDVVLDTNLAAIQQCPEYPTWVEQFSTPSGVDPRYDLRLLDL